MTKNHIWYLKLAVRSEMYPSVVRAEVVELNALSTMQLTDMNRNIAAYTCHLLLNKDRGFTISFFLAIFCDDNYTFQLNEVTEIGRL